MKKHQAIIEIKVKLSILARNPHANQTRMMRDLQDACDALTYREFISEFLAQAKCLKSGEKHLKMGNGKIDKSVGIFNIPAVFTCPNCKTCASTCYALGPQVRYPSARISRFVNWLLVEYYSDDFSNAVTGQIKRTRIKTVRIHESGDFYSREYADMWARIADDNPGTVFYYYTKSRNTSGMGLDACANTNRVNSLLPDGSLNYGSLEYVTIKAREFNINICPCGYEENAAKCGKYCDNCTKHENMLFIQHSG